ncbi:hypothetical protein U1Q18_011711 [Sarracenia purpurea var. burkii]
MSRELRYLKHDRHFFNRGFRSIVSSYTSQLDRVLPIQKLDIFKIQGRDKRGRKILRIIGKFLPARIVSVDALKKYWEGKIFPKLGKNLFVVLYIVCCVVRAPR